MRDIDALIKKLKKIEKIDPLALAYIAGRVDATLDIDPAQQNSNKLVEVKND